MKKIYQNITINQEQNANVEKKISCDLSKPNNLNILCFFA